MVKTLALPAGSADTHDRLEYLSHGIVAYVGWIQTSREIAEAWGDEWRAAQSIPRGRCHSGDGDGDAILVTHSAADQEGQAHQPRQVSILETRLHRQPRLGQACRPQARRLMDSTAPAEALTQEILSDWMTAMLRCWCASGGRRACCVRQSSACTALPAMAPILTTSPLSCASNGFLVICPDRLGRGRSAYLGSGYDINIYSKCLRALGEFAGSENHFIGTSWGGTILLLFLHMTRSKATKIALMTCPCAADRSRRDEKRGFERECAWISDPHGGQGLS